MSRFIKKRFFLVVVLLLVSFASVHAFDVWQYPASADKGDIFAGIFAAYFAFNFQEPSSSEFSFEYPHFFLDYILPVGLPFSLGFCFDSFRTDQWGIGFRPAYHINFDVPSLDVYLMYTANLDISTRRMVLDHGVRIGLRYAFFDLFCLNAETGYRFERFNFGLAIKLN